MDKINCDASLFKGVFAATLIPMRDDLACDDKELAAHCHELLARGCRGIALFGTTGEGASFPVEEKIRVMNTLIASGISPQCLILGICACAIEDAVQLAQASCQANCLATLVLPPFFYKKVQDVGVIAFYREMIQRVNHPALRLILYHMPQYSGVPLNRVVIETLRNEFHDIIMGIKDSEGNLALVQDILQHCPGMKIFAAREHLVSESIQLGATGVISGMANVFPELLGSLYEYGMNQQYPNHNSEVSRILEILKDYPIFAALKCILAHQKGKKKELWDVLRPPLVPLNSLLSQSLLDALKNKTM